MKFKGKISKLPFSSPDVVDFQVDNISIAKLILGFGERFTDIYNLIASDNEMISFPQIVLSVSGFFRKTYSIRVKGGETKWTYKGKKPFSFSNEGILKTHDNSYKIIELDEKFQVHCNGHWIGTVKKEYESVFDKGEYNASFNLPSNLMIFLIVTSILIIKTEVIKSRNSNF